MQRVVWNPNSLRTISQKTQQHNTDFNILEGVTVHGAPEFVLCNGKIVVAEYQVNASPGDGTFLRAEVFPPLVYDKIIENENSQTKPQPVPRAKNTADEVDGPEVNTDDSFGLTTPRGYSTEVFNKDLGIYQRSLSAHGVRNQQDSSFSLNGGYSQSENSNRIGSARRAQVKVSSPPGGASDSFW